MTKLQTMILSQQDNSELFSQLEDLRGKIDKVQSMQQLSSNSKNDKLHAQELRNLGLKVDKLDIRIDTCQDQLAQFEGFNTDRNYTESMIE
jgi:uncharacterized coiled-coil DUF342 family protein